MSSFLTKNEDFTKIDSDHYKKGKGEYLVPNNVEGEDTTDMLGKFINGHTYRVFDKETKKTVTKGWGRTSEIARIMAWDNYERENPQE